MKFEKPVDTQELQQVISAQFPDASTSVITIESSNQVRVSTNYKINEETADTEHEITGKLFESLKPYLREGMSAEEFSTTDASQGIIQSQKVGPSVADDMRTDAYIAVAIALAAMFLYILLRVHSLLHYRLLFTLLRSAAFRYGDRPDVYRGDPYRYRLSDQ